LALAGGIGVIDMELLSVIRRWQCRDHFSIREISRRTGLSRNTVRKYLRSDSVEPKFAVPDRPSRLDPYADKLSHMLRQEAGKSRKQKRTIKQLHADLVALGYDGSYNRVAAFARDWKAARQREQKTAGRGVFVPLYQTSLRQTHEGDSRISETVIRQGGQKEVRDGGGGWTSW
jgi:transposase